jgi:hypothetical protein
VTALDLPPRERPADAPASHLLLREATAKTQPIRPCRLRQPEPPSRAERIVDRVTLGVVAAMTLMFVGQGLRALLAGWL